MIQGGYEPLLRNYEAAHRRRGTRIAHLVAIPLMFAAVPLAFFSFKGAITALVVGWTIQLLSHTFIEANDHCMSNWRQVLLAGLWSLDQWSRLAARISARLDRWKR